MREIRAVLEAMGHSVTARWLDEEEGPSAGFSAPQLADPKNVQRARDMAGRDIDDIVAADTVISFTDGALARGGRHVEFGIAFALAKRLILVGPREHVFHALHYVGVYPNWATLAQEMAVWAVDTREQIRREA